MRFNPFKSEVNIRPPQPYQAGKKKKNCLCFSDNLNAMLASPIRQKKRKIKKKMQSCPSDFYKSNWIHFNMKSNIIKK